MFAGDNFLRHTGEAMDVEKLQLFSWQSAQRGNDVHLHANPTAGEILHHEYKEKKESLKNSNKVSILSKYGGAEYLQRAPKELLTGQTEEYVEYSRTGQVIKGKERAKTRSKYAEDGVYSSNTYLNLQLISIQCLSITTPRSGVHSTTHPLARGVLHVVTPSSTHRIVPVKLLSRLQKPRVPRTSSQHHLGQHQHNLAPWSNNTWTKCLKARGKSEIVMNLRLYRRNIWVKAKYV